jgi:hypothetical protein
MEPHILYHADINIIPNLVAYQVVLEGRLALPSDSEVPQTWQVKGAVSPWTSIATCNG